MKSVMKVLLCAVGIAFFAGKLFAAEATVDLPIYSRYVWRGQTLNDEPIFQPSVTVGQGPWQFAWFGTVNLTDKATGNAFDFVEHDVIVSASFTCPFSKAQISTAFAHYDYPNTVRSAEATGREALVSDADEIVLTISLADRPLAPTLTVAYDVDEVRDFYTSFGVSHTFDLGSAFDLTLSGSVGFAGDDYNAAYFGSETVRPDEAALNDGTFSAILTWKATETLSLKASAQYSALLDDEIRKGADQVFGRKDVLWGGLGIAKSF